MRSRHRGREVSLFEVQKTLTKWVVLGQQAVPHMMQRGDHRIRSSMELINGVKDIEDNEIIRF